MNNIGGEKMGKEIIYNVHWEGPFNWEQVQSKQDPGYVLYQIYGLHHLYGSNVLLYIGVSDRETGTLIDRLKEHDASWFQYEYDKMAFRLGSIGEFFDWDKWETDKDNAPYEKIAPELAHKIEQLLIFAHQPAYNQINKESAQKAKGIRIFNTGLFGHLFPEVSYRYCLYDA
jgi:hypothetical protein